MPRAIRKPRFLRKRVEDAARLHERFTGHDARDGEIVEFHTPSVLTLIGPVEAIEYAATRDGERATYRHKFHRNSRPALATDGKRLYLIGGSVRFTPRGIVDTDPRTDEEIE